jgi:hypothetical protein
MDVFGLNQSEINGLFIKNTQKQPIATRQEKAQAKWINLYEQTAIDEQYKKPTKEELMKAYDEEETRLENIKKEQAETAYNAKRQAEEEQKVIELQICKKYTDGETLKSLINEYNVSQQKLRWLFKKYKISKPIS